MRLHARVLAVLLAVGILTNVNGMTMEERVFRQAPYIDAAKAISRGDVTRLKQLIQQGIDLDRESEEIDAAWGRDTMTLLLWAAIPGQVSVADVLLRAGANPNKASRRGLTPLMLAVSAKESDFFDLLMRYKADPNKIFGRPNESALTFVLQEKRNLGDRRFVRAEALIRYGADVNLDLDRGETAAIFFSRLQGWREVYWLLEHGASHEARDSVKATLMCYLRNSYRAKALATASESFVYRDKVRDWLLSHGVAPSRVDPALHPNPKCDD